MADPGNLPGGCSFHPRCPYAQDVCRAEVPELVTLAIDNGPPRAAACHFADELDLAGIAAVRRDAEEAAA